MSKTVLFITFKLASGVSKPDFMKTAEKLNNEFISKQKGYISWAQLVDGDTWADMLTWETAEDAQNAMAASESYAPNMEFFALLDGPSIKMNMFTVANEYVSNVNQG